MWSSSINSDKLVESFPTIVEGDVKTKGSWREDFDLLCEKYGVIPCPMIQCISKGENAERSEICRVTNAQIDISSWRIILLACTTIGNKVQEIVVHNCAVTHQHLSDLAQALKKSGCCSVLKLHYLTMIDCDLPHTAPTDGSVIGTSKFLDAFKVLLGDDTCLSYISLKGNNLTDENIAALVDTIKNNLRLSALNLSGNRLTDKTCSALLKALKLNTNMKEISFGGNPITGDCLQTLLDLVLGTATTTEDDAEIKAGAKVVGDKNKAIKELNKKRKKAGWEREIKELVATTDCIVERESGNVAVNRSLRMLDFSHCSTFKTEKVTDAMKLLLESDDNAALPPAAMMTKAPDDGNQSFSRRSTGGGASDCMVVSFIGLGWCDLEEAAHDAPSSETFCVNTIPKAWFQLLV